MVTNKGLGKGLNALLVSDELNGKQSSSSTKGNGIKEIKLNDISPNSEQPRQKFDNDRLNELAESIKENGIIQPIIVQKKGSGYRIIAGERRWRASRIAGLDKIPAIVRELSDEQTMEQALIENIQREDLNPLEEAMAMNNLLKSHKLSQEKLAQKLGKPRATIANTIRLINIDESLQDFIINGDLSAGHAKALLALKNSEEQRKAANVIIAKDLSVRQAEEYIKKIINAKNTKQDSKPAKHEITNKVFNLSCKEVETKLKKTLGSKVKLKLSDQETGKGKIVIDYKNYEDLDRLIELISQ